MANEELGFVMETTPESYNRLRALQGRFGRTANVWVRRRAELLMMQIRDDFHRAITEEWSAGGHTQTGASIGSLRVRMTMGGGVDMSVVASMGGGGVYVNYGSAPHVINARAGGGLYFQGNQGSMAYPSYVNHPGYVGDPFMPRAVRRVNLHARLAAVALEWRGDHWGTAENAAGEAYTQGQQLGGAGAAAGP